MERSWFETIQLLGLDVMGVVALVMLLLAQLVDAAAFVGRLVSRRLTSRARRAPAAVVESTTETWPPKEWRPSH
jgi:Na+-transporting methylmalonyl-CoA/oxaloacetate decarboxylase gamma subunit